VATPIFDCLAPLELRRGHCGSNSPRIFFEPRSPSHCCNYCLLTTIQTWNPCLVVLRGMAATALLPTVLFTWSLVIAAEAAVPTRSPPAQLSDGPNPPFKCHHDALEAEFHARAGPVSGGQSYAYGDADTLLQAELAPLRIFPMYTYSDFDATMDAGGAVGTGLWARTVVIPQALARFNRMLKVRPVVGALKAHRVCKNYDTTFTPAICSAYQSETFVLVPGLTPDVPAYAIGQENLAEDKLVVTKDGVKTITTLPAGSGGWPSTDTVVFVTGRQTTVCAGAIYGTDSLAYASYWQKDQYDRPTFIELNLCPAIFANLMTTSGLEVALRLVEHALAHGLAFSSSLFPLFRYKDADVSPRTPRDPTFPWLPSLDNLEQYTCDGTSRSQYLPAENTLQFFNERGMFCNRKNATARGNCVMRLVLPAVQSAAATFFGCGDLEGAELVSAVQPLTLSPFYAVPCFLANLFAVFSLFLFFFLLSSCVFPGKY
jgi:hypothetical protein